MVVGRCTRDDTLERAREVAPRRHAELQRYRRAGAWTAAAFTFPRQDANLVDFYESRLMLEYSRAVILEGDNAAGYADLEVFLALFHWRARRCTCVANATSRRCSERRRRHGRSCSASPMVWQPGWRTSWACRSETFSERAAIRA